MPTQPDYSAIPDGDWHVVEVTDDYIRSEAWLDTDKTTKVQRTQYLADDLLQRANAQEYEDSEGLRFADRDVGALGTMVARVPLNVFFDQLGDGVRSGDRDHLDWWLNQEANKPFRTFKGKI